MGKILRSDALKLKGTPFYTVHVAVPIFGILIFLGYMGITGYEAENLTANYFTLLSLIFPILAAWVCSIVTDQEVETGGGFFMLSMVSRAKALFSKLVFLLGFGLAACLLVIMGFGVLAPLVRRGYAPSFQFLLGSALIVWGCSLFLYFFHTWLSLKFGRNVSFAAAAVELLLAALMLTGLGDTVWFLIPSAWGMRLMKLYASYTTGGSISTFIPVPTILAIVTLSTLGMGMLLFVWMRKWEGRKNEE